VAVILTNARLFTGAADLTGASNKIELDAEREEKDVTTFLDSADPDSGWKKFIGGLGSAKSQAEGFWEAGDLSKVDDTSWADLGGLSAWTALPTTSTAGSLAWFMKALRGKYTLLGQVGDVAPWAAEAASTWPLVRGSVANPPGTARTTTGSGTAVQMTAVSATQYLYASLHVLSIAGTATPTITVKVQSNVDNTFGAPTDRLTFAAATVIGGQILRVPGPITDTWYRAAWTISGSSPSFLFLAAFGIA
jgi:hypothetical protein